MNDVDLSIVKTDLADPVTFGDNIVYAITAANAGPDPDEVTLVDTLPAGVSFVQAVPSQGICSEASGLVTCTLGTIAAGGMATVSIEVNSQSTGIQVNSASVSASANANELNPADNTDSENTLVQQFIGDRIWLDSNGNGLQDPGEPGVVSALVYLFDAAGTFLDVRFTDTNGNYSFDVAAPATYSMRFIPPSGHVLAPRDQGADDALDSDADPATGDTVLFSPVGAVDEANWDAGMVPSVPCIPPDEPIYLYNMTMSTDGNDYAILHFMDANQTEEVTGYNIYRSSDASLPPGSWPLEASNIIDMDEATPNKQWVDISGDISPTGVWFYQITAYNSRCPAEGPR